MMQFIDAIHSEVLLPMKTSPLFTRDAYASQRPLFASMFKLRASHLSPC
jgi:hypothetical protein